MLGKFTDISKYTFCPKQAEEHADVLITTYFRHVFQRRCSRRVFLSLVRNHVFISYFFILYANSALKRRLQRGLSDCQPHGTASSASHGRSPTLYASCDQVGHRDTRFRCHTKCGPNSHFYRIYENHLIIARSSS